MVVVGVVAWNVIGVVDEQNRQGNDQSEAGTDQAGLTTIIKNAQENSDLPIRNFMKSLIVAAQRATADYI